MALSVLKVNLGRKCIAILTLVLQKLGTFRILCCIFNKRIVKRFSFIGSSQNKILRDIPTFVCTVPINIKLSKIHVLESYTVGYILYVGNLLL